MKMKKLTASILLAACTFACACGDKGSNGPTTGGVVTEPEHFVHYVDGTLHDVNVDFNTPAATIIENGTTNYKIVTSTPDTFTPAGYISQQFSKATGVSMPVIASDEIEGIDQNTQYILIGFIEVYANLGGEVPTHDTLGPAGYQIVTYGKNAFINAYSESGYHLGALAFLREVIGYDMLSEDCIVYEKDGKVLPQMDITERPDFDYRQQGGTLTPAEVYGMGYTNTIFIDTGEAWMHNWWDFVSPQEVELGIASRNWMSSDKTMWQACWTAHGDKESYLDLIDFLTEKVKKYLKQTPTLDNIVIGQHDVTPGTPAVGACKCKACVASFEYYGGTMAGAWLSLCNRVSLNVDEWLQSPEAIAIFGENKEFNLVQLVYGQSINPPAEKDPNGNYQVDPVTGGGVPKQEVWFNENGEQEQWVMDADENSNFEIDFGTGKRLFCAPSVNLLWAASAADYTHSYYETENISYSGRVKTWSGFNGDFYVWVYSMNFQTYMHPYNSFDTSFETTRFFKELGAKYIFWQGVFKNNNPTGFVKLRNYLDSKVEFDVNADYQHYLNKFFKYYFGEGSEAMKRFYDEVVLRCREIEEVNNVRGFISNKRLSDKENWPQGMINSWMSLIEKAYDAVAHYKTTDPTLYESYNKHILIEEMFPRYVLCTSYADAFSTSELKAMRQNFADNFFALGNTSHSEHGVISEVFDHWDLD